MARSQEKRRRHNSRWNKALWQRGPNARVRPKGQERVRVILRASRSARILFRTRVPAGIRACRHTVCRWDPEFSTGSELRPLRRPSSRDFRCSVFRLRVEREAVVAPIFLSTYLPPSAVRNFAFAPSAVGASFACCFLSDSRRLVVSRQTQNQIPR